MSKASFTPSALLTRFSARLHQLVLTRGFRLGSSGQSELSFATNIDPCSIRDFLAGSALPTWDQLAALCAALDVQPGFFLDTVAASPYPSSVIGSACGGESMSIRLPDTDSPRQDLSWVRGARIPDVDVTEEDLVVISQHELGSLAQGAPCVVRVDGSLAGAICTQRQDTTAVVRAYPDGSPRDAIVPLAPDTRNITDVGLLGPVVYVIRSFVQEPKH